MAATRLNITGLPTHAIGGALQQVRVSALDAAGAVVTSYTGTVTFTSSDPLAALPAVYTFTGGDAGTRLFQLRLSTIGTQTVTASDGVTTPFTSGAEVTVRPPGWGVDDLGILPYGDAAAGLGAHLVKAMAVSTRGVDVTVSNLVRDNSPFLAGDALNPATWQVQRLDNNQFLHVVSVTQSGTYSYVLNCLEEFGSVDVTHRVSTSSLLTLAGDPLDPPRSATFLGILDEDQSTIQGRLAQDGVSSRDIANPQLPDEAAGFLAGTFQLDGAGDYRLESGASLVRKLIFRELMSRPGDFFHLPSYGLGLKDKDTLRQGDLTKLKKSIELICLKQREVKTAVCSLMFDPAKGILSVQIRCTLYKTGEVLEIGFAANASGVLL